ncbi:hypothetical protein ACFWYW_46580 [Nonomuraea sp. NPDC059023]|uniref:hypothetical protein n=1 Tax=unclassified Nonomuraea TaxID=2593643 RepID=UPI00369A9940
MSPNTLHAVAEQVREAHQLAQDLWSKQKREAAHPRNIAGIVLIRRHGHDKPAVWKLMGVSRTMGDQEIFPHAPIDAELPDLSEADALRIIAEQRATIDDIDARHQEAVKARREGVSKMTLGEAGDQALAPAEIASLTGLTIQQIASDLAKSWQPMGGIARMLGVHLEVVEAALRTARDTGVEWPTSREDGELLFDPIAFRTWWTEHRYGWATSEQLSAELSADPIDVDRILTIADEIGDAPTHDFIDGELLFEPTSFRAWWLGRTRDAEEIAEGWAGATALAYEVRMPITTLLPILSAAKKSHTIPPNRQGGTGRGRGRDGRQYEVEAFRAFMSERNTRSRGNDRLGALGHLAARVGQPEHVVSAWIKEAVLRGIELPPHEQGPRGRLFDLDAFPAWWDATWARTRGGTLAGLPELANLLDTDELTLVAGLEVATIRGVVLPPQEQTDSGTMFLAAPFRLWWPCWQTSLDAQEMRMLSIAELADEVELPREKVKRQIKAALERGRVLPPHTVNERGHRLFELAGYKAWRTLIEA